MRIAAMADLHCRQDSRGLLGELLGQAARSADVLVLAGDLTDQGRIEEMEVLLEDLQRLPLPVVAVLGNHDHEQEHAEMLCSMLLNSGVHLLDCSTCVIQGVGFIGTKGFCGGFGARRIQPFGEKAVKDFVSASVNEVMRMERALQDMNTVRKVGVVHYAPVRDTLQGESTELYPFLGTSLLADAFDRCGVDVVFHGHAHNGSLSGRTSKDIPVFNVSRFVRVRAGEPPYLVYSL